MKLPTNRLSPNQRLYQAVYRIRWKLKSGYHPPAPVLRRIRAGPLERKSTEQLP